MRVILLITALVMLATAAHAQSNMFLVQPQPNPQNFMAPPIDYNAGLGAGQQVGGALSHMFDQQRPRNCTTTCYRSGSAQTCNTTCN